MYLLSFLQLYETIISNQSFKGALSIFSLIKNVLHVNK